MKPENILVQQSGHVTLTDFDLSRDLAHRKLPDYNLVFLSDQEEEKPATRRNLTRFITLKRDKNALNSNCVLKKANSARVSPVSSERSNSFVGTDEYVAPEIIRGDGHEFAVDWWALGVLCYEMLFGATPFRGRNRKETYRNILFAEPAFVGKPNALTGLIRRLLEKDPTRRLGYRGGASEIKEHEFFRGLRWDLVTEISRPPFLPSDDETETRGGGMYIWEYFEKLNSTPSSLWSPSPENSRYNGSFADF
ncbi:serine/threonine-protein kinase ucnl [Phtheirospermum japonicum]|uniref:non-specific serine/threonine protein kinase n=1 Tax=Phtheirospermum japonicum TaxID=374723 RepID=A0A830D950_9LAMI|nr:serine/threonine-protein kinase ucnl [Phtheirospermum japonicum]